MKITVIDVEIPDGEHEVVNRTIGESKQYIEEELLADGWDTWEADAFARMWAEDDALSEYEVFVKIDD